MWARCTFKHPHTLPENQGCAVAWWLMPRTPDPEVGGSNPTLVKPCCVLEQGTFTTQKYSGSRGRAFEPHSGQTVLCP